MDRRRTSDVFGAGSALASLGCHHLVGQRKETLAEGIIGRLVFGGRGDLVLADEYCVGVFIGLCGQVCWPA